MDNPKAYEIDVFFHNNTASFRNSLFKCFVSRYGVGLKTQTKLKSYDSYRVADEDRDAGGMALERKIHWFSTKVSLLRHLADTLNRFLCTR